MKMDMCMYVWYCVYDDVYCDIVDMIMIVSLRIIDEYQKCHEY